MQRPLFLPCVLALLLVGCEASKDTAVGYKASPGSEARPNATAGKPGESADEFEFLGDAAYSSNTPADDFDPAEPAIDSELFEVVEIADSPSIAVTAEPSATAPMAVPTAELPQQFGRSASKDMQALSNGSIVREKQFDHEGQGPGRGGDKFDRIVENDFKAVKANPLSTFSIDVDTASYAKTRQYLLDHHTLPPVDSVRIEELVNYFVYDYEAPANDAEHPFAAHMEVAECPWQPGHRIVRIGLKGKDMARDQRPASNLVFLLDVSGSMNQANKLPLLKQGMKMLVDQLGENDSVAIVVYAGASGLALPSTSGNDKPTIINALDQLQAGGSTNGGAGIRLAYQTALDNFIKGGVNRVILCTDGDFNVGTTSTGELIGLAEENAKKDIFLSVMGFGTGNLNDSMMEQLSGKANGNYSFIDTEREAKKVLVEQMSGTLVTIAKDVKIQVEFNPAQVQAYRLIGYENRLLAAEDFNDDKKDAGEIGAGHTVTALYEIVPVGVELNVDVASVDDLKYQANPDKEAVADDTATGDAAEENAAEENAASKELLTLKLRYKQPTADESTLVSFPLTDNGQRFGAASGDFKFATGVAAFGMLLRGSQHKGNVSYAAVQEIAGEAAANDSTGYRKEFLELVKQASAIAGE